MISLCRYYKIHRLALGTVGEKRMIYTTDSGQEYHGPRYEVVTGKKHIVKVANITNGHEIVKFLSAKGR